MNVLYRTLLFIYSLIVFILSAIGIIVILNIGGMAENVAYRYQQLSSLPSFQWYGLGVGSFLFLVSMLFLFFGVRRRKTTSSIEEVTETGHMSISITAIDSLVYKAARKFPSIQDMKVQIRVNEGQTLNIGLKATVDGRIPIPTLTQQLQESVKTEIEKTTEMEVKEISVKITDIAKPKKSRARVE